MEKSDAYTYTKIRENIWQIAEDNGVYCTLVKGKMKALLVDTGYGHRNLRRFVEENISTPYIVINSHGHPDHIGGNHWFDVVYAAKEEWDVVNHFEEPKQKTYQLKEIKAGEQLSLGDIHIDIVPLSGHTKGSIGMLVKEEDLLIAGDAVNEGLWLFNYGSLSMRELYGTLKRTMQLEFSTYLCGHSNQEYVKENLLAHIRNIENLKIDESTRRNIIGFETYCSSYEDEHGRSEIIFTKDKAERWIGWRGESMRRKDREVTDFREIIKIMDECEIVRLGLADGDYPYIVPVNFAYKISGEEVALYIHGAMAGRKYEMLKKNPLCSFEMDIPMGMDCIYEKKDVTMRYKCVMGKAKVEFLDGEEKQNAIDDIIMARYEETKHFDYNKNAVARTAVAKLTVTEMTAKVNPVRGAADL